jgi:hypothetical protein
MSEAERFQRAKSRQGKLTPEQWAELEEDILRLLNGKRSPKTLAQIEAELVKFCGWDRHKIKGPRCFVYETLMDLYKEGKAGWDFYMPGEDDCSTFAETFWRASNDAASLYRS